MQALIVLGALAQFIMAGAIMLAMLTGKAQQSCTGEPLAVGVVVLFTLWAALATAALIAAVLCEVGRR